MSLKVLEVLVSEESVDPGLSGVQRVREVSWFWTSWYLGRRSCTFVLWFVISRPIIDYQLVQVCRGLWVFGRLLFLYVHSCAVILWENTSERNSLAPHYFTLPGRCRCSSLFSNSHCSTLSLVCTVKRIMPILLCGRSPRNRKWEFWSQLPIILFFLKLNPLGELTSLSIGTEIRL